MAKTARTAEARAEQARKAGLVGQGIDSLVRRVVRRRDELQPAHLELLKRIVEGTPTASPEELDLFRVLLSRRR